MKDLSTGYENQPEKDEQGEKSPQSSKWEFENVHIGSSGNSVYVNVMLDGEVIGMMRLPGSIYLAWIRERFTINKEDRRG